MRQLEKRFYQWDHISLLCSLVKFVLCFLYYSDDKKQTDEKPYSTDYKNYLYENSAQPQKRSCHKKMGYLRHEVTRINSSTLRVYSTHLTFVVTLMQSQRSLYFWKNQFNDNSNRNFICQLRPMRIAKFYYPITILLPIIYLQPIYTVWLSSPVSQHL